MVSAARELLRESGAEKLTTRVLADRLGIKAPSLYKHFPDSPPWRCSSSPQMLHDGRTAHRRGPDHRRPPGPLLRRHGTPGRPPPDGPGPRPGRCRGSPSRTSRAATRRPCRRSCSPRSATPSPR
ncbi:helix-turn-helix domain-containing protein [Streptomyces sp. G5(2025)]|uniref:helix-turn-helix domain-containing protein n=1 Tax=Streptomyces sp. G5(2025) TaxID=3406628 RepID=UPI003C1DBD23